MQVSLVTPLSVLVPKIAGEIVNVTIRADAYGNPYIHLEDAIALAEAILQLVSTRESAHKEEA